MKNKYFTLFIVIATMAICAAKPAKEAKASTTYYIEGRIENFKAETDVLKIAWKDIQNPDKIYSWEDIKVKADGSFKMKGKVKDYLLANLDITQKIERSYVELFITADTIRINIDANEFDQAVKSGGVYDERSQQMESATRRYNYYNQLYRKDKIKGDGKIYRDSLYKYSQLKESLMDQYIEDNSDRIFTAFLFNNQRFTSSSTLEKATQVYERFSDEVKGSGIGCFIKQKIDTYNKLKAGSPAPDFVFFTVDGKKISLTDYRGQYVLLNFWVGGTGWSKNNVPVLNDFFEKYNSEKFQLLNILCFSVKIDVQSEIENSYSKEQLRQYYEEIAKESIIKAKYAKNMSHAYAVEENDYQYTESYGVFGLYPVFVLISADGKILFNQQGVNFDKVNKELEKVMQQQ